VPQVTIAFGSATGNTEGIAELLSKEVDNASPVNVSSLNDQWVGRMAGADPALLGSSTWGASSSVRQSTRTSRIIRPRHVLPPGWRR
jgi:flavodoxin